MFYLVIRQLNCKEHHNHFCQIECHKKCGFVSSMHGESPVALLEKVSNRLDRALRYVTIYLFYSINIFLQYPYITQMICRCTYMIFRIIQSWLDSQITSQILMRCILENGHLGAVNIGALLQLQVEFINVMLKGNVIHYMHIS